MHADSLGLAAGFIKTGAWEKLYEVCCCQALTFPLLSRSTHAPYLAFRHVSQAVPILQTLSRALGPATALRAGSTFHA